MKVRNVLMAAAAVAVLGMASMASATTVTLTKDAYQNGTGGEFHTTLAPGDGTVIIDALSSATWNVWTQASMTDATPGPRYGTDNAFQTFCIEPNETFSNYGVPFAVTVDKFVQWNGGSAQAHTNKPLKGNAAWLFDQFWNGGTFKNIATNVVVGYDYKNDGGDGAGPIAGHRNADAGLLQQAIWYEQYDGAYGSANAYTAAADAADWSGTLHTTENPNGSGIVVTGKVYVMNLWTNGTNTAGVWDYRQQSQLVELTPGQIVPLPAAAWAGMLMLGGLVIRRVRALRSSDL